jgi:hypothetical protein
MTPWHSLYWTSKATLSTPTECVTAIASALSADGYTRYDPFGLLPAPVYPDTVKLFASPLREDWGRVVSLAALPPSAQAAASLKGVAVALSLNDTGQAAVTVYVDGAPAPDPAVALVPYANPDMTDATLAALLALPAEVTGDAPGSLPLDVLPEPYRDMADQLNPQDIEKLFEKMAGSVFRRGGDREAAEGLLRNAAGPDWTAGGGAAIRRLLAALTLPDDWIAPAFIPLRDAYALHTRRQRKPNARLYPGDAEAMRAVPNALDYTPLFVGKDA